MPLQTQKKQQGMNREDFIHLVKRKNILDMKLFKGAIKQKQCNIMFPRKKIRDLLLSNSIAVSVSLS